MLCPTAIYIIIIMKTRILEFLRNIGIAAHIDAGKTTLTERILYYSGKNHKIGNTHTGDTIMDHQREERERGITITAAATQTNWEWMQQQYLINIIDTPGHVDFTVEVERSLRVLDAMVALFCAVGGVEPQSETVWRQANRYGIPRIAFINKMDLAGADFNKVLAQIRKELGANAIALQIPIGEEEYFSGIVDLVEMKAWQWVDEKPLVIAIPTELVAEAKQQRQLLLEALAEFDETIFHKFFKDPESISVDEIKQAIRRAVLKQEILPVLCGTAYKNKGVEMLLDAICVYFPSPFDLPAVEGTDPESMELISRDSDSEAPFSALVFKIALDEQNRKVFFFRVYSGSLEPGAVVLNPRTGKKERFAAFFQLHGAKRFALNQVLAGDIAAVLGLKNVQTGDTLCASDAPILLESIQFPEPVIGMAIEAKNNQDLGKLSQALAELMQEDPTFKVKVNAETAQTIIYGMGELHLEVLVNRLTKDLGIECTVGEPEVTYREVLTFTIQHTERFAKQNGGQGLFAEISIEIGPADESFLLSEEFLSGKTSLQFVNDISGGAINRDLIPSVRKGFEEAMKNGLLKGYELEHLKVRLFDGQMHSKDSKPLAFELCAKEAFRTAGLKAMPMLMEPLMLVEVLCPDEYIGTILASINKRRGVPLGMHNRLNESIVKAEVPLVELFGYAAKIRQMTKGKATATLTFSRFAVI